MPPTTLVVKVGTSSILNAGHLAISTLASLVETLCELRAAGARVILVSSGAVGVGCQRLGVTQRPTALAELQAMAAVGQPHLMHTYETLFSALSQPIAQVLLSADALGSRSGYQNVAATFEALLSRGVIPVVNENDSVSISELRFGDNDTLSALVATLVGAEWLFLATDVDALYTSNPNNPPEPGKPPAKPIRIVEDIGEVMGNVDGSGSQWGTGGMATKLRAAQLAGAAGCTTTIIHALQPKAISAVVGGSREVGTSFLPRSKVVRSHKRWIMALPPRGTLTVDAGAARAITEGSSLFARGVTAVSGSFSESEAVRVLDAAGTELARGTCNFSDKQATLLIGKHSVEYHAALGWHGPEEVVHRHNMVLLSEASELH